MNRKTYIIASVALSLLIGCLTLILFSVESHQKEPTLLEKLAEHRRKYV
jgi:hypothetical protein